MMAPPAATPAAAATATASAASAAVLDVPTTAPPAAQQASHDPQQQQPSPPQVQAPTASPPPAAAAPATPATPAGAAAVVTDDSATTTSAAGSSGGGGAMASSQESAAAAAKHATNDHLHHHQEQKQKPPQTAAAAPSAAAVAGGASHLSYQHQRPEQQQPPSAQRHPPPQAAQPPQVAPQVAPQVPPPPPPPPMQGWSRGRRLAVSLAMPLLVGYCCAAFGVAWLLTLTVLPSYVLAQRLYWACPFIPHIWARLGPVAGTAARLGFEASHCINILTRLLTLPLRPHLPSFYILGFPKCGTTSLAEHLKSHPGLSATAGLPYHEALAKESHFLQGVYGRHHAHSRALYRSCFPTLITRWWHEVVRRAPAWACFDACPVNACMPHTAERIRRLTPQAKFIIMLRDPVPGVFSAEIMMRDMGVPLDWSFMDAPPEGGAEDPRFTQVPAEVAALWRQLEALGPEEPLPPQLPATFYTQLGAVLQCGMYAELLRPFLDRFPKDSFLFVEFKQFTSNPEAVVRQVLQHVGMDPARYSHKPLPPAMKNNYGARAMHPAVKAALGRLYAAPNRRLAALLAPWGQLPAELGWQGMEGV